MICSSQEANNLKTKEYKMKTIITVICIHCKKYMGKKDGRGVTGVSHSICSSCLEIHYGKVD